MTSGELVDEAWEDRTAEEILATPPSALEGLSERHDALLEDLGTTTVADLGDGKYAQRAAALVAPVPLDE